MCLGFVLEWVEGEIFWQLFGSFWVRFKAPGNYAGPFWIHIISISLDPKSNISRISGFLDPWEPLFIDLNIPNYFRKIKKVRNVFIEMRLSWKLTFCKSESLRMLESPAGHYSCNLFVVGPTQSSISSFLNKNKNTMMESWYICEILKSFKHK